MHAKGSQRVSKPIVSRDDGAAVSVAAKRLCGKEARRRRRTERAQSASFIHRTEALRGIVQHKEILGLCRSPDSVVVGWQAEQIHRNDRLWLEASLLCGGDCSCDASSIDIERPLIDIDENGRSADQCDYFGGSAKCERRADDRVAWTNTHRPQCEYEGIGTACTGHNIAGATERSEFRLEGPHLGSKDELAVIEHAGERCIDCRTETPALGGDVNERDGRRIGAQIHRKARRRPCPSASDDPWAFASHRGNRNRPLGKAAGCYFKARYGLIAGHGRRRP